jgi:hypothetical protein
LHGEKQRQDIKRFIPDCGLLLCNGRRYRVVCTSCQSSSANFIKEEADRGIFNKTIMAYNSVGKLSQPGMQAKG